MKYVPHDYQIRAVERMLTEPCFYFMAEGGLGKTVTTLTAADILMHERFEVGKVLVSAPKTVAEDTWSIEAAKWDHLRHLRVSKVLGTAEERIAALQVDADVYVVNHENFVWLVTWYMHRWPFGMVVFDETLGLKDVGSVRFRALSYLRQHDLLPRLVLLSGTPAPNGVEGLWSQMFLLDGGLRLYRTLTAFRGEWLEPATANKRTGQVYSYKAKDGAEPEIYRRIADLCMAVEVADVMELPERQDIIVPVPLPPDAVEMYERLSEDLFLFDDLTAPTAALLQNKLRQLASGAIYRDTGYDERGRPKRGEPVQIHTAKDAALEAIVRRHKALGESVLVFYDFETSRNRIEALGAVGLDKAGWNAGKVPFMALHPASAGYGLNLQQGGHVIVWYDVPWNLDWYLQGNWRVWRQGQTHPVTVYHLAADVPVETRVAEALTVKGMTQKRLLEAVRR